MEHKKRNPWETEARDDIIKLLDSQRANSKWEKEADRDIRALLENE